MSLNPRDTSQIYVVESRSDYIPVVQALLSNMTKKDCLWASNVGAKTGKFVSSFLVTVGIATVYQL